MRVRPLARSGIVIAALFGFGLASTPFDRSSAANPYAGEARYFADRTSQLANVSRIDTYTQRGATGQARALAGIDSGRMARGVYGALAARAADDPAMKAAIAAFVDRNSGPEAAAEAFRSNPASLLNARTLRTVEQNLARHLAARSASLDKAAQASRRQTETAARRNAQRDGSGSEADDAVRALRTSADAVDAVPVVGVIIGSVVRTIAAGLVTGDRAAAAGGTAADSAETAISALDQCIADAQQAAADCGGIANAYLKGICLADATAQLAACVTP